METTANRRRDDRDRMLNDKLDHLERENQTLQKAVVALETTVNVMKLEQSHMKELFDARFKILEASNGTLMSEIKQLSKDIQTMTSDSNNSPATRSLQEQIRGCDEKLETHDSAHQKFRDWQNQVEGVLLFFKWVGAAGLIATGIALFKTFSGG